MARRCPVMKKGVLSGNNVSHANNKTRRRFLPNLQPCTFLSESLGQSVTLRTIEHRGGLDAYLLSTASAKLPAELRRLRQLVAAKAEKTAA